MESAAGERIVEADGFGSSRSGRCAAVVGGSLAKVDVEGVSEAVCGVGGDDEDVPIAFRGGGEGDGETAGDGGFAYSSFAAYKDDGSLSWVVGDLVFNFFNEGFEQEEQCWRERGWRAGRSWRRCL